MSGIALRGFFEGVVTGRVRSELCVGSCLY